MKKKIIFSIVVFIITGFIMTALITTPLKHMEYVHSGDDIQTVFTLNDAKEKTDGTALFKVSEEYRNVVVKLGYIPDSPTYIRMFLYNNGSEDYLDRFNYTVPEGQQYAFFSIPEDDVYDSVEFDVAQGAYMIDTVEFHQNKADVIAQPIYPSIARIVVAVIVSLTMAAAWIFIDKKLNWNNRIIDFFKNKYKKIIRILLYIVGAAVLAALTELVAFLVINKQSGFNFQRFVYINAVVVSACLLIAARNVIKEKSEYVIVALILIIGTTMIFTTSPKHASWDIDSHYDWAINASSLGKTYVSQADIDFLYVYSESVPKRDRESNLTDIRKLNADYKYAVDIEYGEISLPHIPSGIAIAVTRFMRLPFYFVYKSGELANIILYSIICFFGLKKLKSGKMIFAVIAMFPTNIFLASSYSYDFWVTAFSLLGMSYFIGNCQRKDEYISTKDTIIMVAAFALACIPKQVYVILMLVPFLMPRNKIKNKKQYYAICISGFIFLSASLFLRTLRMAGSEGDLRGGSEVNPGGQISYILGNPIGYFLQVCDYLGSYLSFDAVAEYTTCFGYLGFSKYGVDAIILLMIVTAVTDKNEYDIYKNACIIRTFGVFNYIVSAMLIVTAMYVSFTAVGSSEFAGCQPRYIVPLLYPMLATIGSGKVNNNMNRKLYNYIILISMLVIGLYSIYDTMLFRML